MILVLAGALTVTAALMLRAAHKHEAAAKSFCEDGELWCEMAISVYEKAQVTLAIAEQQKRDNDAVLQEWTS